MGNIKIWMFEIPPEIAKKITVGILARISFAFLNYFAAGYLVLLTHFNLNIARAENTLGGLVGVVLASLTFSALIFVLSMLILLFQVEPAKNNKKINIGEVAGAAFWINPFLFLIIYAGSCLIYFSKGNIFTEALLGLKSFVPLFLIIFGIIYLVSYLLSKIKQWRNKAK